MNCVQYFYLGEIVEPWQMLKSVTGQNAAGKDKGRNIEHLNDLHWFLKLFF